MNGDDQIYSEAIYKTVMMATCRNKLQPLLIKGMLQNGLKENITSWSKQIIVIIYPGGHVGKWGIPCKIAIFIGNNDEKNWFSRNFKGNYPTFIQSLVVSCATLWGSCVSRHPGDNFILLLRICIFFHPGYYNFCGRYNSSPSMVRFNVWFKLKGTHTKKHGVFVQIIVIAY